jgi:lipopolysaccharide export system ATP-binding protein
LTDLRVSNVSKRFGERWVLRDVSLRAETGQLVLLTGDNGSGKSTLFEILSGQISADSGSISLGSSRALSLQTNMYVWERIHKRAGRGIRVCRQAAPLFASLTLRDHVRLADPRLVARLNRQRGPVVTPGAGELAVPEALRRFEGDDRLPTELSLGQRRSFAIERQTAFAPLLCLLDEPLAGLDTKAVARIRDDLQRAKSQRTITIVIEHRSNIGKIADLVDEGYELRDGSLHEIRIGELRATSGWRERPAGPMTGSEVRRDLTEGGPPCEGSVPDGAADFEADVVLDTSSEAGNVPPLVSELAAVPLRVRYGQTLAVAAPNGWGKSTICDKIGGAASGFPFALRVTAGGTDLSGLSPYRRARAGLALVRGSPTYPAKTRVSFLYRLCGVEPSNRTRPFQARHVSTLSGGEMRFVQLELALRRPTGRFAVLDEPLLGLDNIARSEAATLIAGFAARGTMVIFEPTDV